jgi:tetratricopeptide (TPR) repeat protein
MIMPRQRVFLILAITAILLAGCSDIDPDRSAVASRLDAAIAQLKTIPMPSSPSPAADATAVNIPDQMEVRRALRKGDIAPLKAYLPGIARRFDNGELSEPTFDEALLALWANLPEAVPALDAWVTESPDESAARLARAIVRARMAWDARGDDFYRYIPKVDIGKMLEWDRLAADDLTVAIRLSKRPIRAVRELIGIAQVAGGMRKKSKALFVEGTRIAPASSDLYSVYVPLMYAEWGGGPIAEAEAFVAQAKTHGVDQNAWGSLERGLYNANHGNIFDRDATTRLAYVIESSEKYDTYDTWFRRSMVERELGRLEDAEKSLNRAEELRPGQSAILDERGYQYELRGMFPDAVTRYERALKLESAWAYDKLIYAYLNGGTLELQKDLGKARILCEDSASMHLSTGEFCLSRLYHNGWAGLAQDDRLAAAWESLAAHHGHAVAAQNRGWRLIIGKGLPVNREEGIFWLRRAARLNNKQAIELLQQHGEPIEDPATVPSFYSRMKYRINRLLDN